MGKILKRKNSKRTSKLGKNSKKDKLLKELQN